MTVEIELKDIPPVAAEKKEALQQLANNVDLDVLQKLAKLSTNKKAVDMLKNPSTVVKLALNL